MIHTVRKYIIENRWVRDVAAGQAAVFLLALVPYLTALGNDFVLDDFRLIVFNDFITRWQNILLLVDPLHLLTPYSLICGARPLTVFSLLVDHCIWQLNPFGYHLTNILLHGMNAGAVFVLSYLCYEIFNGKRSFGFAFVSALIFAFHPLQAEAVNIPSFRGDLLATFFSVSSLQFLLIGTRGTDRERVIGLSLGGALFLLGAFAKEIAVTVPLMFFLYLLLSGSRGKRGTPRWIPIAFFGMVLLFFSLFWIRRVEYQFFSSIYPNIVDNRSPFSSLTAYGATLLQSFGHNIGALLFPYPLCIDYQIDIASGFSSFHSLLPLVIIGLLVLLIVRCRDSLIRFGIGFFLAAYIPVSNIIPLINTVNDRYLYLPMAGFAMALAAGMEALPSRKIAGRITVRRGAALLLLLVYASLTMARNPVFRDMYSLYAASAKLYPDNVRVRYNLGIARMGRGEYTEAMAEFSAVTALNPLYKRWDILQSIGDCHAEMGNNALAEKYYWKYILATLQQGVVVSDGSITRLDNDAKNGNIVVYLRQKGTAKQGEDSNNPYKK